MNEIMMIRSIFIASSAELKSERMELIDLLQDLNDEWDDRGIKFKSVVWEFMDSSMGDGRKEDEYLERLKECETCLVIFWKTLGEYTVEELEVAAAEMRAGRSPRRVLVLFKEPYDGITPELLTFKGNYPKQYPDIPHDVFRDEQTLRKKVTGFLLE